MANEVAAIRLALAEARSGWHNSTRWGDEDTRDFIGGMTADEAIRHALDGAEKRIAELEAALRRINALIDSPGTFNGHIQEVLDSVIDTSDVKF